MKSCGNARRAALASVTFSVILLLSACGNEDLPTTAESTAGEGLDQVDATPDTPAAPASNKRPAISGSPSKAVTVGKTYNFVPAAVDPENDSLTFSIAGKPAWATFEPKTGRLSGVPKDKDKGSHEEIVVTVSDGAHSVSLPEFSITVDASSTRNLTLAWLAPTENVDGTQIGNLKGYKIYYGSGPRKYSKSITLGNPGLTRYTLPDLTSGTYYFAITAISDKGTESEFSLEASHTIGS
jgi:hypothetical protein